MVGDLRMSLGHGDVWIGVPVQCYTECNTSNHHSYHMGDPFVHDYSHMGYTFEGLTGRTSINEVRERIHEAHFRQVQALPQKDDIFTWLI